MFNKIATAVRKIIAAIRKALSPNKLGWRYTRVIRHAFFRVETKSYSGYTDGLPNGSIEIVETYKPYKRINRMWEKMQAAQYTAFPAMRLFIARVIVAWYIVAVIYSVYPSDNS